MSLAGVELISFTAAHTVPFQISGLNGVDSTPMF